MSEWYRWDGEDLLLTIHTQPRASKDELVGPHGDSLKVRITAPPLEGRANAHLVEFLAKIFGVPKSHVSFISGETGRHKRLRIQSPKQFPSLIEKP